MIKNMLTKLKNLINCASTKKKNFQSNYFLLEVQKSISHETISIWLVYIINFETKLMDKQINVLFIRYIIVKLYLYIIIC